MTYLSEYAESVLSGLGYEKTMMAAPAGEMPLFSKDIDLVFSRNLPRISLKICLIVDAVQSQDSWRFTQKASLGRPSFKLVSTHESGIAKSMVEVITDKIGSALAGFPVATEHEPNAALDEEFYRLTQASLSLPVENVDLYFEAPVLLTTADIRHVNRFGGEACITGGMIMNSAKRSFIVVSYLGLRDFVKRLEEEIRK